MNIDDLIKAVECCSLEYEVQRCAVCPYIINGCAGQLKEDILKILKAVKKYANEN